MSELEPTDVEARRVARERALELLYEAEVKGVHGADVLADLPLEPDELTADLVRGVHDNLGRIDGLIAERVAPRWTLARLASVDRAVLRMATYELLEHPETPVPVAINEAVVLSGRFGTDDSSRFVNGVLSAIASEVRP